MVQQKCFTRDSEWKKLYKYFNPIADARQIIDVKIELVRTSCGMAVPYFNFVGERTQLKEWSEKKGEDGIRKYWKDRNLFSIDSKKTDILD